MSDGPINLPLDGNSAQIAARVARLKLRGDEARRKIAEALCEASGAHLYCTQCKHEETLTIDKSLEYIADGWPSHCERTMVIRTREKSDVDK